ncbi:flagellar export chaperone FlgN [Kolteria novifilia]|uniref:flagellar export chaperone FlgN n=1 Tax=Kolteria novifilia TaxID=2527975 RepID=UPI003AF393AE
MTELSELQLEKQRALASLDADELVTLSNQEEVLSSELARQSKARDRFAAEQLEETPPLPGAFQRLVRDLPSQTRAMVEDRLARIERLADAVKLKAASNWLLTYRNSQHVDQVLGIIANAANPSHVPGEQASPVASGHGLVLDSTA